VDRQLPVGSIVGRTSCTGDRSGERGAMTDQIDSSPRSLFLRFATWLANGYLVAFAGDALLSVADDGLRAMAMGGPALSSMREAVAFAVVLASVLMPFLLLFVPQLPKRLFLAPIAFALCFSFGTFGLPVPGEWLSAVQLVIAAATFGLIRAATGHWLLAAEMLRRKRHLVARTVFAMLVTIVALPLVVAGIAVVLLGSVLERQTAGYLDVTPTGVDVRERVLTKDGRTVVLKAMAHYGEDDFYRTLFDGLPPKSLVLAEGLTDREKRLRGFPSAAGIANMLGLTQQPGMGSIRDRKDQAPSTGARVGPANPPDIVRADVDAAEFSDDTLGLLQDLAELYAGNVAEGIRKVVARTRADPGVFTRELIDKRNAHVLAIFDEKAGDYTTIVIPWGALHMPGLEAGLEQRGYRVESERTRPVVRFGTIVDSIMKGRPS
jgi:hypothetical protein